MPEKRIALVTGANQGVGLQVAKELVANGVTVLIGSRNFERGEAAAREIGVIMDGHKSRRIGGAAPRDPG
jgi:NAD(P)-dependent dehydrogenase (short-subunit alcohol dehydrogenase family)